MKKASEKYKLSIREPWRNPWNFDIQLSTVNETLSYDAKGEGRNPSPLAVNYKWKIFYKSHLEEDYHKIATFEKDRVMADGSMIFTNKSFSGDGEYYQGFVSEDIDGGHFEVSFTSSVQFKGFFIAFEEAYPKTIVYTYVTADGKRFEHTLTDNEEMNVNISNISPENVVKVIFDFALLSKPYRRLRIRTILFGNILQYTNRHIITGSANEIKESQNSASLELPTKDLTLSVDNTDNKYDFLNQYSPINLLEQGQDVDAKIFYTYEDGSRELVKHSSLLLDSFKNQNDTFVITAVDYLRNENASIDFVITPGMNLDTIIQKQIVPNLDNNKIYIDYNEKTFKAITFNDVPSSQSKWQVLNEPFEIHNTLRNILKMIASATNTVISLNGSRISLKPRKTVGEPYTITKSMYDERIPKGDKKTQIGTIKVWYYIKHSSSQGKVKYSKFYTNIKVNKTGKTIVYDNPFIFSFDQAKSVGAVLADYYRHNIVYDCPFVGDPTIEVGDIISLENNLTVNPDVIIEKHDVYFTTGSIRGRINAKEV